MNHNDYIFSAGGREFRFLRRFEEMYKSCEDPHGQSNELQRVDYQLVSAVLNRVILSVKRDMKPVRVLDVGCGLGYFTSHIQKVFPDTDVSGCDISLTAIEKARVHAPQCQFFPIDLKVHTSLPNRLYNIIVALDVVCYFTEHEILDVVRNLYQLLEAGGFLLVGYHLSNQMKFGRYIQSLDDAKGLFEANRFTFRLTWDVINCLDTTYAGDYVGRHIYFLAQKGSGIS